MTAYEQLLEQLPPDRRVGAALQLEQLAHDPNSPIYRLYTEVLASIETKDQERESREKLLFTQLAKDCAESDKNLKQEIKTQNGHNIWKRIAASNFISIGTSFAIAAVVTPYFVKKQVSTVDPLFHERIESVESEITKRIDDQAQLTNLKHDQLADLIRENTDLIKKTHVTTAAETLLGKGISYYVSEVSDTHISVSIDRRTLTLPHRLTPTQILQLKIAIDTTTKIKLK